jgi:hypothetical protein
MWEEIQSTEAFGRLREGAVGIGEDHNCRSGRDLAIALLRTGVVKALFLEDDWLSQSKLNAAYRLKVGSAEWRGAIYDNVNGPMCRNPVDLSEVAMEAMRRPVPAVLIDEAPLSIRKGALARRDAEAAVRFGRYADRCGRRGCLLLYGGNHFSGPPDWYDPGEKCLGELLGLEYVICR